MDQLQLATRLTIAQIRPAMGSLRQILIIPKTRRVIVIQNLLNGPTCTSYIFKNQMLQYISQYIYICVMTFLDIRLLDCFFVSLKYPP